MVEQISRRITKLHAVELSNVFIDVVYDCSYLPALGAA